MPEISQVAQNVLTVLIVAGFGWIIWEKLKGNQVNLRLFGGMKK